MEILCNKKDNMHSSILHYTLLSQKKKIIIIILTPSQSTGQKSKIQILLRDSLQLILEKDFLQAPKQPIITQSEQ